MKTGRTIRPAGIRRGGSGIQHITEALILRAGKPIGEADRQLTALTRELGIVRATARGVRKVSNRNAPATGPLAYSRLTLVPRRGGTYFVTDAQPLRVFFEVRRDVVALALAQYWCELACALCPTGEDAGDALRLLLNALHFLCAGGRSLPLLKALVELRLLAGAGYAPVLERCVRCGGAADDAPYLLPREGGLCCAACGQRAPLLVPAEERHTLPPGGARALRMLTLSPPEEAFALRTPPDAAATLARGAEALVLERLGRGFASLDMYHSLAGELSG